MRMLIVNHFAKISLLCVSLVAGCGQDFNSHSGDRNLGKRRVVEPGKCDTPQGARFCAAVQVLQDQCFRCHGDWARFETDQQWLASGYVVAGDPETSNIVKRLINSGSNMPLGGSALPTDEYNALVEWVTKLSVSEEQNR